MANRQYVGARYVPKFADPVEWNKALSYETLTIVTHLGNSFTSKKPVPAGIDIGNGEYWVNTGNYNEQIENYKAEVSQIKNIPFFPMKLNGADNTGVTPCDDIFDEANAAGYSIYFEPGTYKFTRQHVLATGVSLYSDNAIITSDSFGKTTGVINDYGGFKSNYTQMVFKATNKNTISGLKFNTDAGCIFIEGNDVHISNCSFTTFATVSQVIGETGYYGIAIRNSENIHICGCKFDMQPSNNRDGIHIEGNTKKVFIEGCNIKAGDDAVALNALEGDGDIISDVYISNCFIGGYGVRFFGGEHTPIKSVKIENCTIDTRNADIQTGAIRFSNTTSTVGGEPLDVKANIEDVVINNVYAIGNTVNLSLYFFNANVKNLLCSNCNFNNVIYFDANTDCNIKIENCNCPNINIIADSTGHKTIFATNFTCNGITKAGGTVNLMCSNCNVEYNLNIQGSGDYIKFTGGILKGQVSLTSVNSIYELKNVYVDPDLTIACVNSSYYISNLVNSRSGCFLTSGASANRITGNVSVDSVPSQPVFGDFLILFKDGEQKALLKGATGWFEFSKTAYNS